LVAGIRYRRVHRIVSEAIHDGAESPPSYAVD
jgi:hypothetical protein